MIPPKINPQQKGDFSQVLVLLGPTNRFALTEEKQVKYDCVSQNGNSCQNRVVVGQYGSDDDCCPVQDDDQGRVEADGEIVITADDCQTTEVPAIQRGKGMESQQFTELTGLVVKYEFQPDIQYTSYCRDKQESQPGDQKIFLLH